MTQRRQIPMLHKGVASPQRGTRPSGYSYTPTVVNGYFEINKDAVDNSRKVAMCRRPGVLDFEYVTGKTNLKTTNSAERVTGLCTSLDKSQVIFITQDATKRYSNIYTVGTNTLTQTDISANFTAGEYALTVLDGINYGSGVYYAATNGTTGGLISSTGVWSKITDADYTNTGTKTNFVGLDGYLFYGVISGTGAGRIYNSDLSTAAAASGWVSTSYIQALDVPGSIVWLQRIRNYIVALKQYSIEFFEDVGNPTPGSPLEARKHLTRRIGCASASSVQEVSDGIIFMGVDSNGKFGIYKIFQDSLEVKKISDDVTDGLLQNASYNVGGFQSFSNDNLNVSGSARGQSQVIIFDNKELYTTTLYSYLNESLITMVYDNELEIWSSWATSFGADETLDNTFIPSMCFLLNNTTGGYWTCFANNFATNTKSRFNIIYTTLPSSVTIWYQDQYELATTNVHDYPTVVTLDFFDCGTNDLKFGHSLDVIYDANTTEGSYLDGTAVATGTLTLKNLIDDYVTGLSTRSKTITDLGGQAIRFTRLGRFRRISPQLLILINSPIRIWSVELVWSGGPEYA